MLSASSDRKPRSEEELLTPRKLDNVCRHKQSDSERDNEPHHTPLWVPPVAIPTEQCTPEVSWGEFARHLKDGSHEQDTPTPFPCGGPQACLTWTPINRGSLHAPKDGMLLPGDHQNTLYSMPAPLCNHVSASPARQVVPGAVWEELMLFAREGEESWQQWLSQPPCPAPARITQLIASSMDQKAEFPDTAAPMSPAPMTPARRRCQDDELEAPSTPRKARTLFAGSPVTTPCSASVQFRNSWSCSPPVSWSGHRKKDQENRNPNVGHFASEFGETATIKESSSTRVFRAQHKLDRQFYAIKTQKTSDDAEQQAMLREVNILSSIWAEGAGCANLLRYFSCWQEDGLLHVQTEPYEYSLRERLSNLAVLPQRDAHAVERELPPFLSDTATGLWALHSKDIVHMDVKPENIVINGQGCFKVAGLAHSCRLSSDNFLALDYHVLNSDYTAPEVSLCRGKQDELRLADVFSLALVACELAAPRSSLRSDSSAWQQLRSGHLCEPLLSLCSDDLVKLLRRMLNPHPENRPACDQIRREIGCPQTPIQAAVETSREQRKAELREALRRANEATTVSRQRVEDAKLELDALRRHKQDTDLTSKVGVA